MKLTISESSMRAHGSRKELQDFLATLDSDQTATAEITHTSVDVELVAAMQADGWEIEFVGDKPVKGTRKARKPKAEATSTEPKATRKRTVYDEKQIAEVVDYVKAQGGISKRGVAKMAITRFGVNRGNLKKWCAVKGEA